MRTLLTLLALPLLATAAFAQPDVIVGDLNGISSWGTDGTTGIYAYSVGTTSCNIGSVWLNWMANINQHPVIGQSVYRVKNGRFEQIGFSWLKHGFYALSGNLCFNNCSATDGTHLGVHCSDPYDSGLNGGVGGELGPRNEVNASTGYFPYPVAGSYPPQTGNIGRRIQCQANDVNPTLNAGAVYFAEAQYVTPDDAAANNQNNNASCRKVSFGPGAPYTASFIGSTIQQSPAIMQWPVLDATVATSNVDIAGDGRFIVAKKVTSLGGANYHYEFAIHNLNSDRSGRGFTVNFPNGTTITNTGFKSVPYHSGEPYSSTPWTITNGGNSINWATQLAIVNLNANALRFGTTYNFWFDATAAAESSRSIELFKPTACPADPVVPPANGYTLNTAATFDNPALPAPQTGPNGDDVASTVPIGFTFNYYGTNYSTINLCTNGFANFGAQDTTYANTCLPDASTPNGTIAVNWVDLVTTGGPVTYQTLGVAPSRRFVAFWNNAEAYPGGNGLFYSFKMILDETTNKITSTMLASADGGATATRGVEDASGVNGMQASCNVAGSAVAGTSQTYTPYSAILPSATLTLTGSTGPGGLLTWNINSNARSSVVVLIATTDPGPTNFGSLGTMNIGLSPGSYVVLADGLGFFQAANPNDKTDWYCGDFSLSLGMGAGVPPGITFYSQGVVVSSTSVPPPPNGAFHITTQVTRTT